MFRLLDQYNCRERNYVANYFISGFKEGSLCLSPDYLRRLGICVGMGESLVGARYYAAFEYNYDWLYAALMEYNTKLTFPQAISDPDFIRGKFNFDMDLLIVFYNEITRKYDFYLVEAKFKQIWDRDQIKEKLKLLRKLLSMPQNASIGVFRFIFCSDDDIDNSSICDYAKKNFSTMKHFSGFFTMILQPMHNQNDIFFQKLEQYNQKEMAVLARDALKQDVLNNVDLQANIDFPFEVKMRNSNNYFVAIDYSFKALFHSLGINCRGIRGQTDCDCLFAWKCGGKYKILIIEAKHFSPWNESQLENKMRIIKMLKSKLDDEVFELYFIQFGKKYKQFRIIEGECKKIGVFYNTIFPEYSPRYKTKRCNSFGNPDKYGRFWGKQACLV